MVLLSLHISLRDRNKKEKERRRRKRKEKKEKSSLHLLAGHLRPRARAVAKQRHESDLAGHLRLRLALFRLRGARPLGVGAAGPRRASGPLPGRPHGRLLQQPRGRVDDGGVLRVVLSAERGVVGLGRVVGVVRVPEGAALDGRGGVDLRGLGGGVVVVEGKGERKEEESE